MQQLLTEAGGTMTYAIKVNGEIVTPKRSLREQAMNDMANLREDLRENAEIIILAESSGNELLLG
jgi:hypothetical protein